MQSVKALLFGILLVVSGVALTFIIPQSIFILQATFGLGDGSGSPVPLLVGSVCSVIFIFTGMLIGYRGYLRSDDEA